MKDYFCPISAEKEIIEFVTNNTGTSRYNLTNELWHKKNEEAARLLFGFNSFDETLLYIKNFFADVNVNHFPKTSLIKKKITTSPSKLTELEQITIAKMFMQSFSHRTKLSCVLSVSRQCISDQTQKWMPMWATYGSYLSILVMPHDYHSKELPDEHRNKNLNKITHLFDGKDVIAETPRKNDSLKRRIRSEKVHDSGCRTINFTTPMGLSFKHTRAVGARASEKKIMEWWGGHSQHKFHKKVPPPKPCWLATEEFKSSNHANDSNEHEGEEDLIKNVIDDCAAVTFSTEGHNSSSNYNEESASDDLCTEIDDWFDNQLSISPENDDDNDPKRNNSIASFKTLQKQCDLANSSTPQHDVNELANQLLVSDRLDHLHENSFLEKCMLSAHLLITREFRNSVMVCIGLPNTFKCDKNIDEPTMWLRSAKLPADGEGLADKGFEF